MKLNQLMALATDKDCETVATGFQHLDPSPADYG